MVRARSPLRISFGGGGTDLPQWYEQHGGAVLSCTINRYAYVTLYPRNDKEIRLRSVDLGYAVKYDYDEAPTYDGVLDLAKAVIKRVGMNKGMALDIRSDAPAGSGLGGSSALTSAIIGAVSEYAGQHLAPYDLAEMNYNIERIDLGMAGGKQDPYATAFGGFNLIEFQADGVLVNPLRIDRDIRNDLEAHLMLCYTGGVRTNLGLIDKQVEYLEQGADKAVTGLQALTKLAHEMKAALLKGELTRFGQLLHESYTNKKRMNPHIAEGTNADELYERARKEGATGGKLLGAGGGGYLLLYCETHLQHRVRSALEELGGEFGTFAFMDSGLEVWHSVAR
jgi:D-glycero-alpha-D-manno-heptose-7-phosphate kinase